jgi:uncharacterized protein
MAFLRGVLACGLLMFAVLLAPPAHAQQDVPALTAHVIDQTGTLSAAAIQQLEKKLTAFEASHGSQVVLLLVPTTQPEDISSYANRVANHWKIGRREIGDGIVVVVAKNDRRARIEVAKTLEGAIPDLMAKRVIDGAMTPRFKQGDFAGGLDVAVDQIAALIRGEGLPTPTVDSNQGGEGLDWRDLAIFMFAGVPILAAVARSILGKKLGALATGAGVGFITWSVTASLLIAAGAALLALFFGFLSGMGSNSGRWGSGSHGGFGSGGSGGFGGGGFGSGGGGDFGGGGASGDW